MIDSERDIQDYLDAASDASKRTRTVIIVIVAASVLMLAGFLNSLQHNWMLQRVRALASPNSAYMRQKLPEITDENELKKHQEVFYAAIVKSYVENTYTIRVPFFGITFDVNDLGLLGGIAFIILLVLFRFSLARELDNLIVSFEEVQDQPKMFVTFYNLLAMRQVLTTPPTHAKETVRFLMIVPKMLSILPFTILTVVIAHDFLTYDVGASINAWHTVLIYIISSALWAFVLILTVSCLMLWFKMDGIWHKKWQDVQYSKTIRFAPRDAAQADGVV